MLCVVHCLYRLSDTRFLPTQLKQVAWSVVGPVVKKTIIIKGLHLALGMSLFMECKVTQTKSMHLKKRHEFSSAYNVCLHRHSCRLRILEFRAGSAEQMFFWPSGPQLEANPVYIYRRC